MTDDAARPDEPAAQVRRQTAPETFEYFKPGAFNEPTKVYVEKAQDHYLRQIRNAVVFLAILAGVGVAVGLIEGLVIAVRVGNSY